MNNNTDNKKFYVDDAVKAHQTETIAKRCDQGDLCEKSMLEEKLMN